MDKKRISWEEALEAALEKYRKDLDKLREHDLTVKRRATTS